MLSTSAKIKYVYLYFTYLIWIMITIYDTIKLTTVVKSLKSSEKNPHAVYWFVIICSWRENILGSSTHSNLQLPNKSIFCTKMLEVLASFVAVWQNNVTLNTSAEHVMAYAISVTPHSLNLNSASYKQHKTPVNIQHIVARMGIPKKSSTRQVMYRSLCISRNKQISACCNLPSMFPKFETHKGFIMPWSTAICDWLRLLFSFFEHIDLLSVSLIQLLRRLLRWRYLCFTMKTKLRYWNKNNALKMYVAVVRISRKIKLKYPSLLSWYMLHIITVYWMTVKE